VPFRAHAPASRDGRSLPPADHAVPQLHGLLHRGAMASVLDRSLRSGAEIEDLRVTLVDYQPGSGATVAYDVAIAGARHVAVAMAGHALCPEAARTDARRAIARALGRHSPVARPLTYDVGLGALVQWYPLDLAMPVLARPVPELLRLVARAGIAVASDGATTSTLVYRPGQRAVIRTGDVVLKAYAEDVAFRAGVSGLRIAAGLGLGAGPRLHGALPELRLTVQSALDGVPVPRARAREVAPIAGAMLAVLHDARVPGLTVAASTGRSSRPPAPRASPRPWRPAWPAARSTSSPASRSTRPTRTSSCPPTATSTSARCSTSTARWPCSTSTRRASRRGRWTSPRTQRTS
jgi:hypothetical protein